jgi:hypothetical protein
MNFSEMGEYFRKFGFNGNSLEQSLKLFYEIFSPENHLKNQRKRKIKKYSNYCF